MPEPKKQGGWKVLACVLPEATALRLLMRRLRQQFLGDVTDRFIELLLDGMAIAFFVSKKYRRNIDGFSGRYVFQTNDGAVAASAAFENGRMNVYDGAIPEWHVRVTFENAKALRAFLFSQNQDVFNSVLKNEVSVDGNLNYIYKFAYMARDLTERLKVAG